MLTNVAQRWAERRGVYRPAGEPINTRLYEVAPMEADSAARAFVERHHYSASFPAARFRFGLYQGSALVGVAVFSVPMNDRALSVFPCPTEAAVELGRFVLLEAVPANGETWFFARCRELLPRHGIEAILSFSDPEPRTALSGAVVFPGHVGTIYQASNATYRGTSTPRTLRLLPDGTVASPRTLQKIRSGDRGARAGVELLVRHGARPPTCGEDMREWLREQLPHITRPHRHGGNHRYLWGLSPLVRRHLPSSLPYPKVLKGGAHHQAKGAWQVHQAVQ